VTAYGNRKFFYLAVSDNERSFT